MNKSGVPVLLQKDPRMFCRKIHCVAAGAILLLLLAGCGPTVKPVPTPPPPVSKPALPARVQLWAPLIERLERDGFARAELVALFSSPEASFSAGPMVMKLHELVRLGYGAELNRRIQQGLLDLGYAPGKPDGLAGYGTRSAIKQFQKVHGLDPDGEPTEELYLAVQQDLQLPASRRPHPPKPKKSAKPAKPPVYGKIVTPKQLAASKAFYTEHQDSLRKLERDYGVPGEIAVGVFTVETGLGTFFGDYSAMSVLASMALAADFNVVEKQYTATDPKGVDADKRAYLEEKARIKGNWAYNELKSLIRYSEHAGANPWSIPGSMYGAIGIGQFMPSNAVRYGMDGDGDARVDLFDLDDMLASFGKFMRVIGWQGDMRDRAKQRRVLLRYNRSTRYVNTVLAVADFIRPGRQ